MQRLFTRWRRTGSFNGGNVESCGRFSSPHRDQQHADALRIPLSAHRHVGALQRRDTPCSIGFRSKAGQRGSPAARRVQRSAGRIHAWANQARSLHIPERVSPRRRYRQNRHGNRRASRYAQSVADDSDVRPLRESRCCFPDRQSDPGRAIYSRSHRGSPTALMSGPQLIGPPPVSTPANLKRSRGSSRGGGGGEPPIVAHRRALRFRCDGRRDALPRDGISRRYGPRNAGS